MNTNLSDFLLISRALYRYFKIKSNSETRFVTSLDYINEVTENREDLILNMSACDFLIKSKPDSEDFRFEPQTVNVMIENIKFILEALKEGSKVNQYVVLFKDGVMYPVMLYNYIDEFESVGSTEISIPLILTNFGLFALNPLNDIVSSDILSQPGENVTLDMIPIIFHNDLHKLINTTDKGEFIKYLFTDRHENGDTNAKNINYVLHCMASSMIQDIKYIKKDLYGDEINDTNYQPISTSSDLYKHITDRFELYKDSMDNSTQSIEPFTFREIVVKDTNGLKALTLDTTVDDGNVNLKVSAVESFENVLALENVINSEILVECPDDDIPNIIKLPSDINYIGYNLVSKRTEYEFNTYNLISFDTFVSDKYRVPVSVVGTESLVENVKYLKDKGNEKLMIPLKKFGVVAGTKLYELIYPVTRLPLSMAKNVLSLIFGMFKSNMQLEKEQSDVVMERTLNDDLDTSFMKIEMFFTKLAAAGAGAILLGGWFGGIIMYFLMRRRYNKIYTKSVERVERRILTKIREYEQKIDAATQESDYEAIKALNSIRDGYKEMLDKVRETKSEALGKDEKYTDTYKDYQDQ